MKKILAVMIILSSGLAFASTTIINCKINYTSPDGIGSIYTLKNIELSPFTYKDFSIGNFSLRVGVGGTATIATGEKYPMVSVEIFDNNFEFAQDGGISPNPNFPPQASYQSEENKESLDVSCAVR